MSNTAQLFLHLVTAVFRVARPGGVRALVAENLQLKQQLLVLNRARKRAPAFAPAERIVLGTLTAFIRPHRLPRLAVICQPQTLLNFHKALVQRKYRKLFASTGKRRKAGPKGPSTELIQTIVELKQRNPCWGTPQIAAQLWNVFGIEIDKDVVRRVLAQHHRPPPGKSQGPSWLSFLGHTKDSLWSVDLFRCESIRLQSHWVMVVMDQCTRKIIGFAANAGDPAGPDICRIFNAIIAKTTPPDKLSSDHDPLFQFHRWKANLRILEVEEIKTVPYVPLSHPFVERLIGTIRRELLDQTLFWNAADLQRKLDEFKDYYNCSRVHQGIDNLTPLQKAGNRCSKSASLADYHWQSHCRGLFQTPVPA